MSPEGKNIQIKSLTAKEDANLRAFLLDIDKFNPALQIVKKLDAGIAVIKCERENGKIISVSILENSGTENERIIFFEDSEAIRKSGISNPIKITISDGSPKWKIED